MRWKVRKYGDRRIYTWFAFLPVNIGGEVRWLELVTVEQKYLFSHWSNEEFVDGPGVKRS